MDLLYVVRDELDIRLVNRTNRETRWGMSYANPAVGRVLIDDVVSSH